MLSNVRDWLEKFDVICLNGIEELGERIGLCRRSEGESDMSDKSDGNFSQYVLQEADGSFCKECHSPVSLLCHKDFAGDTPAFYICFKCGSVGQVGVGPVEQIDVDADMAQR